MRKKYTAALKVLAAGFAIVLITSCPSPITEALVAAVEDSFVPVITVTSPEYSSKYKSEVTITGYIEDNAITDGDGKGAISEFSYSAGSLKRYKGRVFIDSEGQITQDESQMDNPADPVLRAYESITFDPGTGEFSFTIDSSLFSGPMQFEITAIDRNNNSGTEFFLLNQSAGPYIEMTNPVNSLYTPGEILQVSGIIGDSVESPDTIGEIAELRMEIPTLYITGADSIVLDVASGVEAGDLLITETCFVYGIFDLVLDTSNGEFSADIQIADSQSGSLLLNLYVTDKNGIEKTANKNLSENTGDVSIFIFEPSDPGYYSPSSSDSLLVTGSISPKDYAINSLEVSVGSDSPTISKDFIASGYYSPTTGSFSGFIDLTAATGPATLSIDATTVQGGASTASRTLIVDTTSPAVSVSGFSVGTDGNSYARGGERAYLNFNISDSEAGINWSSLNVSIGGLSAIVSSNESTGVCSAYIDLIPQNDTDPLYPGDILPYSIEVEDLVQNSTVKNQNETALITYYHSAPTTLDIEILNNTTGRSRIGNGQQSLIRVTPGRILTSASEDIILFMNGSPLNLALAPLIFNLNDVGGSYEYAFPISSVLHPQGNIGYYFEYEDLAGNANTYDGQLLSLLVIDYTPPSASLPLFLGTSGGYVKDGDSITVEFNATDNFPLVDGDLRISTTGGGTIGVVEPGSIRAWKATYTADETDNAMGTVSFRITDPAENQSAIFGALNFDNAGPDMPNIPDPSTWYSDGDTATVTFSLDDAGIGGEYYTLSDNGVNAVANSDSDGNPKTGEFSYIFGAESGNVTVTVTPYDGLDNPGTAQDVVLRIDEIGPDMPNIPDPSAWYSDGDTATVTFSLDDAGIGGEYYTLSDDGVNTVANSDSDGNPKTGEFSYIFGAESGDVTVTVTPYDGLDNPGTAQDVVLKYDNTGPTMPNISDPASWYTTADTATVSFTLDDAEAGGEYYTLSDNGVSSVFDSDSDGDPKTGEFSYTFGSETGNVTVTVTPYDGLDNPGTAQDVVLKFDGDGPDMPNIPDPAGPFADGDTVTVSFSLDDAGVGGEYYTLSDNGVSTVVNSDTDGNPKTGEFSYTFGAETGDVIVTVTPFDSLNNQGTAQDVLLDFE